MSDEGNEGSIREPTEASVGNVEKKKVFFFGSGSKCSSFFRPVPAENNRPAENTSAGDVKKPDVVEETEAKEPEVPSVEDENGESLLQKISEVLGDEPDASASSSAVPSFTPTTFATCLQSTASDLNSNHSEAKLKEINEQNYKEPSCLGDSHSNNLDQSSENQEDLKESEAILIDENLAINKLGESEKKELISKEEVFNEQISNVESKFTEQETVAPKPSLQEATALKVQRSIVPYDDDDSTSSSINQKPEEENLTIAEPQVNESASDSSESITAKLSDATDVTEKIENKINDSAATIEISKEEPYLNPVSLINESNFEIKSSDTPVKFETVEPLKEIEETSGDTCQDAKSEIHVVENTNEINEKECLTAQASIEVVADVKPSENDIANEEACENPETEEAPAPEMLVLEVGSSESTIENNACSEKISETEEPEETLNTNLEVIEAELPNVLANESNEEHQQTFENDIIGEYPSTHEEISETSSSNPVNETFIDETSHSSPSFDQEIYTVQENLKTKIENSDAIEQAEKASKRNDSQFLLNHDKVTEENLNCVVVPTETSSEEIHEEIPEAIKDHILTPEAVEKSRNLSDSQKLSDDKIKEAEPESENPKKEITSRDATLHENTASENENTDILAKLEGTDEEDVIEHSINSAKDNIEHGEPLLRKVSIADETDTENAQTCEVLQSKLDPQEFDTNNRQLRDEEEREQDAVNQLAIGIALVPLSKATEVEQNLLDKVEREDETNNEMAVAMNPPSEAPELEELPIQEEESKFQEPATALSESVQQNEEDESDEYRDDFPQEEAPNLESGESGDDADVPPTLDKITDANILLKEVEESEINVAPIDVISETPKDTFSAFNNAEPDTVAVMDNSIISVAEETIKSNENIIEEAASNNQLKNNEEKQEETPKQFTKPAVTRKRKMSESKSVSESDSDGDVITDAVSYDNSSGDEEVVQKKKPRMRGKPLARKMPAKQTTTPKKQAEEKKEVRKGKLDETPLEDLPAEKKEESKPTIQDLQFDFDGSEDIAANVAAIRTMISKDSGAKKESASEDESVKRVGSKRSRKARGRLNKRNEASSSSDEDSVKQGGKKDSKRSKTQEASKEQSSPIKKKRESGAKGLLKYIDTSLVIDTTENETPVRQSRRIAQQKVREESERRQMEEKMLKQMKAEAEKKKMGGSEDEEADDDDQKDSSGDDESFKESRRKKKSKIKPSDKQWQTSSSHSEQSEESDHYMEHVPSDPGSPLFRSDHEFSPESDDDDATQVQPLKRARTAKKLEAVASSEDEDINPTHACQVCHKTDSPEWILLCDECDHGYHCSCLKPIIFLIPSGNWYCPLCCHKKLVNNLSEQLTQLDTMIYNIETAELRDQRQKLAKINEQNILQERRKNRAEAAAASKGSSPSKSSSRSSESDDSSDNAPLKDYFYKLRKRNHTAAPSYRFNEYDDLINSAIKRDMDEVKGAGNLGRGKDIATIIEAEEEKEQQVDDEEGEAEVKPEKNDDAESSGSDVIRPKKITKRKKKKRKLNNLDVSSGEERPSDEDFKGTSSSDSEVDEEDLSMSSVSESSLDLPSKKSKGRNVRTSTRNREKRVDRRFINDNGSDSDDEPLVRAKRSKKKNDSDEEDFDANDDDDEEGSLAEEIDSDDLCDDTETDESSDNNWPKRKKKRAAAYDIKPRKSAKRKDENEDKAFRAGISKKKVLKKSDNESDASVSENEKGKRKTRGKKLLYLIEDDLDSDESDGIKPGVKRPETPPEEREMFFKKQEEIKRMLAAKDTEAAQKLAAPTIEPIHIAMEKPKTPSPIPFSNEPASLSTIPKNVIESAKALDTDYNRIKPIVGSQIRGNLQSNDMNEEELARMMEEEDFAQHQLKLAGEAIARKKLLDLEAKEGEFAAFTKATRDKERQSVPTPAVESKKRSRKSKSSEKASEEFPGFSKAPGMPTNINPPPMPPLITSNIQHIQKLSMPPQQSIMSLIQQQQQLHPQPYVPTLPNLSSERPSILSAFMQRPDMHPQHMKMHQPLDQPFKNQPLPQEYDDSDEKRKGRRKKFTPLRTDLVETNISKVAKLDQPSVIQPPMMNPTIERIEDKHKVPRPDHAKLAVAAPPQIFNPATNPTPSVITRLLQPQQRPGPGMVAGPYGQAFSEINSVENPTRMYPTPEDLKNTPGKVRSAMQPTPLGGALPQSSFGEFVPRNMQHLYRGPPGYVIPPHARLPPYPFHHLHPNLRPGEYPAAYTIPPQFSYYAPPAHSRPPHSSAIPLNHGVPQHIAGPEDISNSIRHANSSEEPSETSEFGGLVSYFSSQQELD